MMSDFRALVLIPSYNTGPILVGTVKAARACWPDVWVVIDGSRDGSDVTLQRFVSGVRILRLRRNRGKGAAILRGIVHAAEAGFTHVLTLDADGQHDVDSIGRFMAIARDAPNALVLGQPVFAPDAPVLRVQGRRVSNWWARFETPGSDIGDSLFGMRVYPIKDLLAVMRETRFMRRFDFDPEAAVRLCWRGLSCINLDVQVRYPSRNEGGISQFRYLRDNLLLGFMHLRLVIGACRRHGPFARARENW